MAQVDLQLTGKALSLRLRRDDVPIEGRVINLEGRPIPGLTIRVLWLNAVPAELIDKGQGKTPAPTSRALD